MEPETTPATTAEPAPPTPTSAGACENCGAPLYGKYCYACGQPVHGLVRHFSSVLSDIADTVLNVDERLFRTLGPLYLQPGKLTLDYFAGRRARYVTPFRMVFFLAIIAFFAIQLSVRSSQKHAEANLQATGVAQSAPAPASASTVSNTKAFANGNISLDDKVLWNGASKPLQARWLPGFAEDWLNDHAAHAQQQMHDMASGTWAARQAASDRFMLGIVGAAPTVLFLLLPVFALMLKVFFIFKRRLYMEHLIVAMHSHAFLLLSMLVLVALAALRQWLAPHAGWVTIPFGLATAAAWIWLFAYLLVMQKRVYRQGWLATTFKFCCIGTCYSMLLLAGLGFSALLSLTGA